MSSSHVVVIVVLQYPMYLSPLYRYLHLKFDSIRFQSQKTKSPSFDSSFIKLFLHFKAKTIVLSSQLYLFFFCVFLFFWTNLIRSVLFEEKCTSTFNVLHRSHSARCFVCWFWMFNNNKNSSIQSSRIEQRIHRERKKKVSNGKWVFIDSWNDMLLLYIL